MRVLGVAPVHHMARGGGQKVLAGIHLTVRLPKSPALHGQQFYIVKTTRNCALPLIIRA
jgi:hypothetical protein